MRAVIFDFGGVFVDSPFAALAAAAQSKGLTVEELSLAVFGEYDRDTDHPWHRMERGEMTVMDAHEAIRSANRLPDGSELDFFDLLASMSGGGIRDEMVAFCESLRTRGLLTGLLTNNAREFEEFWKPMLPLDQLFDDVVDSSEVGLRKPDPAIFQLALGRLGVEAGEAVFVDDAPGNVEGARAVGIRSVLIGHDRADVPTAIAGIEALLA